MIRRSHTRDNPSDRAAFNVSGSFGTRVADTILAAVVTDRVNRPDIRPQSPWHTYSKKLLQPGGRPHTRSGKTQPAPRARATFWT